MEVHLGLGLKYCSQHVKYIYIYIHTCVNIYIYVYMYVRTHVYICIYLKIGTRGVHVRMNLGKKTFCIVKGLLERGLAKLMAQGGKTMGERVPHATLSEKGTTAAGNKRQDTTTLYPTDLEL